METDSVYHNVSIQEFSDWLDYQASEDNPLGQYCRTEYSCYIDYKHMKDMFDEVPHMLQEVDWSVFGLDEFNGEDSTIWLSSEGANTPAHQDSYGFNLVTQLMGRKLWILFPPEDSEHLYPSRVPYEESSIFSQVNILRPNLELYPLFKESRPVVVTLCPGQTLYVPRHWWHFVCSLEPAISVNVWVPVEDDKRSRLEEAVTRCLATSIISSLTEEGDNTFQDKLLNPTERLASGAVNLLLLETTLSQIREGKGRAIRPGFGHSCAGQSKLEKDYFRTFTQSLAGCDIREARTPFLLDHKQLLHLRKRRQILSESPEEKKMKHDECGGDDNVTTALSQKSDVKEGQFEDRDLEASKCGTATVFSLRPCTFSSYLNFLESLHHQMFIEDSQGSKSISSDFKEASKSVSNQLGSNSDGGNLLLVETGSSEQQVSLSDQQEESKTSAIPTDPRLGYSLGSPANSCGDDASSKEQQHYGHSKEQQHYGHSKEQQDYGHSKEQQHYGHSKEQQHYGHSKEQQHYGHSKEQQDYGHSKEQQDYGHSKEQQHYDHTKEQQHYGHSKEQQDYGHSKEQQDYDHSKEQQDYGHSKEQQHYGHSKEQLDSDTRHAIKDLSCYDIAEALLASALHPDVIHTISNLFVENCDRMLREKSHKC